jgi:hypothetical protein
MSKFGMKPSDQCPYTDEELEEMRRDRSGGRTLAEIWKELGREIPETASDQDCHDEPAS